MNCNQGDFIKIFVNGKERSVPIEYTIEDLLEDMGFHHRAAVWVNGKQILLRDYPIRKLKDSDQIKLIKPLGGG